MAHSVILTIFGITGDLSQKKLIPALYNLFSLGHIENFHLIGFGRRQLTEEDFTHLITQSLDQAGARQEKRQDFIKQSRYFQGNFDDPVSFTRLAETITSLEENQPPSLRLFYYATSPDFFGQLSHNLKSTGLTQSHAIKPRVIIEKPFGHDLVSAQTLNHSLLDCFDEDQIYRIDHYLGKDAVQNVLAFRFANSLFTPMWNKDHIDHIQLTLAETVGIEGRGEYYDQTGTMRDMVQNHALQLLAQITMREPAQWNAEALRHARQAVVSEYKVEKFIVGQYEGYHQDPEIKPDSPTETFAAVKLTIDNPLWHNVPIYIRTGKRLAEKKTTIAIQFKDSPQPLFSSSQPNIVTFQFQPNPSIDLYVNLKSADKKFSLQFQPITLCEIERTLPLGDYERLILDCIMGDQMFFVRSDEVEAAWRFMTPILDGLPQSPESYQIGSWGPATAQSFIEQDGYHWL